MDKLKISQIGYTVISVVFYIAGIFYMFVPQMEPLTICILSGVILIVYGSIKIIGYFAKDLYCLAFQYDLACGILLITLGIIVLARNLRISPYLSLGLGLLILLDSVLTVQMSKDAMQFGLESWYIILIISVIAGAFGVLLMIQPFKTRLAAHILAGSALIAAGLKSQCVITLAVKSAKNPSEKAGNCLR